MKCPSCGHNQRRGREGMACSSCHYAFAYDPKQSPRLSDSAVLAAVRKASANGTWAYTDNQLRTALMQRMGRYSPPTVAALFIMVVPVSVAVAFIQSSGWSLFGVLGFFLIWPFLRRRYGPHHERVEEAMRLWPTLYERVADQHRGKRIMSTLRTIVPKNAEARETDLFDYGVERVLIVDEDYLVDLFVANGIPAEHRVLLIAQSGYPQHLQAHAVRVVNERPDLPVFLLHGVSSTEMGLPAWFDATAEKVVSIGLRPEDLQHLPSFRHVTKDADAAYPVDVLPNVQLHDILQHCFAEERSMEQLRLAGVAFGAAGGMVIGDFG